MSAGVSDQRMKGQGNSVSNGPKDQLGAGEGGSGTEEFETWRSQQQNSAHTPYGASAPISSATDIYNMSYYGSGGTFPYQGFGVGDGAWSNGTDPMTFLSQYPPDSYSMEGMFGPSTTFSTGTPFAQPSSFNYFHSNGDFSNWGSQLSQQQRKYDEYYRDQQQQNMYTTQQMGGGPGDSLKSVEQAMQSLDLKTAAEKDQLGQQQQHQQQQQQQQKKTTWASIASQPAKPQLPMQSQGLKKKGPGMPPGPIIPGKHNMDIGTWETNKATPPQPPTFVNSAAVPPPPPKSLGPSIPVRPAWSGPPTNRGPPTAPRPGPPPHPLQTYQAAMVPQHHQMPTPSVPMPSGGGGGPVAPSGMMPQSSGSMGGGNSQMAPPPVMMPQQHQHHHQQQQQQQAQQQQQQMVVQTSVPTPAHPVLDELRVKNNYNPGDFDLLAPNARFFVIKSYSEDDIHRSIKYEIWCSTEHGNKRLDQAFREREPNGCVYLFFSVNGSGHFCGMAQMISAVDYNANSSVWSQDKWKGQFKVRWIYVKDVPNVQLKYIRLENNENKPVTNSRDTQEVPHAKGIQVLKIIHSYRHSTSIFDDFIHYEKRQEEEDTRKQPGVGEVCASSKNNNHHHQHHHGHAGGGGGGGPGGGGHDGNSGREPRDHYHHHHNNAAGRGGDNRDQQQHRSNHRGGGGGGGHHDRGSGGGDRDNNERQESRHGHRNYDGDRTGGERDNRGGDRHHHHHERHHKDNGRGRGRNSRI